MWLNIISKTIARLKDSLLLTQTVGHFMVDAACAAVVISGTQDIVPALVFFVLYNFLAFCMQPLAGFILDKVKSVQPKHYILASFILLLPGFMSDLNMWVRVLLVGVGNCLFHTGAGTLILNNAKHKMAPLGIFVSSGAVGLFSGMMWADSLLYRVFLMFALCCLILFNLNLPEKHTFKKSKINWAVAGALCLCIMIRSCMGFIPLTQFHKTPMILFIITLGVFVGKSLGGILCDKWGIRRVVLASTIVVMALFLFSFNSPFLWTLVQIIVNLSMPITLYLMYKSMPAYPAFSFGLAASFLVIGWLCAQGLERFALPGACFLVLFVINSGIILYSERRLN